MCTITSPVCRKCSARVLLLLIYAYDRYFFNNNGTFKEPQVFFDRINHCPEFYELWSDFKYSFALFEWCDCVRQASSQNCFQELQLFRDSLLEGSGWNFQILAFPHLSVPHSLVCNFHFLDTDIFASVFLICSLLTNG